MSIPFVSISDTLDQWREKTNTISVSIGDLVLLTTPVTSDIVSALNEVNQRLVSVDQTALRNVVEDPTPELGGNLNLNSNNITGNGNINITGTIDGIISVGGDLSGTTDNAQIVPGSVGIAELDFSDGTAGQFLKTDGVGGLSFDTIDISSEPVGGDVSGTVSNIQINAGAVGNPEIANNAVGIDKLDVTDGTAGQVLSTDGSGVLSFVDGGIGGGGSSTFEEDLFTGDGTTTTFTLSTEAPSENSILVFIDGVAQPTTSFTLPTSLSIQFPSPPDNTASVRVVHLGIIEGGLATGSSNFVEDLFTGDGTTDFTLSISAASLESILVYVDGISQPTTTYSLLSPTIIRFNQAPLTSSSIRVIHLGISGGGIADGSVTTPKLADNAVTPAKLGAGVILAQTITPNSVGIPELDVADGNNGEFLRTNGAGLLEFAAAAGGSGSGGGGGLTGMQIFRETSPVSTSSPVDLIDTWTKPTDVKTILYIITGGGAALHSDGSGGGAGGTVWAFLDVSNITSVDITVGRGGITSSNTNFAAGQPSRFGTLATADGATANFNDSGGSGNVPADGGGFLVTGNAGLPTGQGGASFWSGQNIGKGGGAGANDQGNGSGENGIAVILEFGGPEETTSSGGSGSSSTLAFQGTTEGYRVGGANASGGFVRSQFSIFNAYSFIVDGNVNSQVGNLSQPRQDSAGFASTTNGYVVGGRNGENSNTLNSVNYSGVLDKFSFTTANTVTQPFTLSPFRGGHTGHTSETHGYWGGGFTHDGGTGTGGTSTDTLIVDRVLFASDNSSTNIGDLDIDFQSPYSTSSTTDGYYIGGTDRNTEAFLTTYRKFSFSSESSGTVITNISGNTVRGRSNSAALCGDGAGYITGGVIFPNNVQTNEIEKLVYASDVMTIEPRTLVRTHVNLGGSSSTTHGYCHGGTNLSTGSFGTAQTDISDQVQKFSFSNNNNSVDIATLSSATFSTASHIQH